MTIPTFTVTGSIFDLLDADADGAVEAVALEGAIVTFTPNTRGQFVSVNDVLYRPEPVSATVDDEGKINGDDGVTLLANDESLDLEIPLQWRVSVSALPESGFNREPKPFWFEAAEDGDTKTIGELAAVPGTSATGFSKGDKGDTGPQGPAATITVGTTTTGNPGSSATVSNSGTSSAAVINFTIPRGDVGATGSQGEVGPPGTTSWNGLTDKPAVIGAGATQADARAAIGAGTSNLALGTTSSTAKRGDYAPSSGEVTSALGFTPENAANKNANNGYAGLDSSGLVPASLLPGFVDDVVEGANLAAFPASGTSGKLYVALDTGKVYRWSGSTYIEVSPSPSSTDAMPEGSVNQYFTAARAQNALTSQLAGKTDVGHTHSQSDVTGLSTSLSGKSDVGHGHVESDITGLTAALGGKQSTSEKNQPSGYAGLDSSSRLTQNTTGSAASLTTPRTIDGQSFDGTANITVIAPATVAASDKTTPVDADVVPLVDSAASNALKKLSWANIKTTFAAYYDALASTLSNKTIASPALTGTTSVAQSGEIRLLNNSDATNFERLRAFWSSNVATIATESGGTGTVRPLRITTGTNRITDFSNTAPFVNFGHNTAQAVNHVQVGTIHFGSSGIAVPFAITPNISQSSTAGYTALLINPTETATGSGTKRLIDAQVGGTSRFTVDNAGNVGASGTITSGGVEVDTISSTATLSNKTLAAPRVNQILDSNGNSLLVLTPGTGTPSAIAAASNSSGDTVQFVPSSSLSNVNLNLRSLGSGSVLVNGVAAVTTTGTQSLSNKTLTSATINNSTFTGGTHNSANFNACRANTLWDYNGWNRTLEFTPNAAFSAGVNYVNITNGQVGSGPSISAASGSTDANVSLNLTGKGTGTVQANGVDVVTTTGTQTLTNKRLASATIPATISSTGTTGQIAYDNDWLYVCTATDTWRRVALGTW